MSNIYGANYHYKKRPSVTRQFSDNVEVPKNYPNLTPNGTLVQKQDLLASVQNLPAVLTDPKKGKQRDFFTRTWGEDFTENQPIPPSPYVCQLSAKHCEKYLKKLRRYCPRHCVGGQPARGPITSRSPSTSVDSLSHAPHIFLDANFDLKNPETFGKIFPFLLNSQEKLSDQIEIHGKSTQEKLAHHLDSVEVNIADQVAQKSHHFFQVMTYHDALMNQLTTLVAHVRRLRSRLQQVDQTEFQAALNVCRLRRRKQNMALVLDKLVLMSSLHETQPTIQRLLSGNEFSGALDLITTSRDILRQDLRGVFSFRHLSCQLEEIQSVIGRMLLGDFKTYISTEINKDVVQAKATSLPLGPGNCLGEIETEHLKSVIFGLLRQNSYTFLEVLEEASISAIKTTFRDIARQVLAPEDQDITLTNLVADLARKSKSQEWLDFFDVLLGSLISLLRRIHSIHKVIMEAIETTNEASNSSTEPIIIPAQQLAAIKSTSKEVLINVCDQVVERSSKFLTQRSRPNSAKLITTSELCSMANLVELLNKESLRMTDRVMPGLVLSLQGQNLLYIQAFDEQKRQHLTSLLEKEKWKSSTMDFNLILNRIQTLPAILDAFQLKKVEINGVKEGEKSDEKLEENKLNGILNNNKEDIQILVEKNPGTIIVEGEVFVVPDASHEFTLMLSDYCELCSLLPSISVELGLKTAELMKFFNSRICQLIIGAGAISVSGLKTITIRNLALAQRAVQLVIKIIPYIRKHFENCHSQNRLLKNNGNNNNNSGTGVAESTLAETKQLETFRKQFEQASIHLKNHSDEVEQKIVSVLDAMLTQQLQTWQPSNQLPSKTFKDLCRQLSKVHESVEDVWNQGTTIKIMTKIHEKFISAVKSEIRTRRLEDPDHRHSIVLLSELTFYTQSLLLLNVIPTEKLTRDAMEYIWFDL